MKVLSNALYKLFRRRGGDLFALAMSVSLLNRYFVYGEKAFGEALFTACTRIGLNPYDLFILVEVEILNLGLPTPIWRVGSVATVVDLPKNSYIKLIGLYENFIVTHVVHDELTGQLMLCYNKPGSMITSSIYAIRCKKKLQL